MSINSAEQSHSPIKRTTSVAKTLQQYIYICDYLQCWAIIEYPIWIAIVLCVEWASERENNVANHNHNNNIAIRNFFLLFSFFLRSHIRLCVPLTFVFRNWFRRQFRVTFLLLCPQLKYIKMQSHEHTLAISLSPHHWRRYTAAE